MWSILRAALHCASLADPKAASLRLAASSRRVFWPLRQTRFVSVIGRPHVGVIKTTAPLFVASAAPSQSGSDSVMALA